MFGNLTGSGFLPSLNALRAFEAMARTGGATRAAEELHVTHSAVSRQVKALEAQLGVRLFEGPRHALTLTRAGRDLLPGLTAAFDGIAAAVADARGEGQDLNVAVNASLSVKWLIPRLPGFAAKNPDIRVHLSDLAPQAVSHRGADLLLRFLDEAQARSLGAAILSPNAVGPVIAPGLAATLDAAPREAVLAAPRLVSRTHPGGWSQWAEEAGVRLAPRTERPVAHLHFALDAALAGWGAAVLPWVLTAEAVQEGRLLAPFGFATRGGVLAALPGAGEASRARRRFLAWLIEETAGTPAAPLT